MPRNILIDPQRLGSSNPNIQFSGSMANTIKLEVLTSGSVQFTGVSGSLLGIVDSLSGSLFAVSDVSGLPILETFSDDRVVMGRYNTNALVVTGSRVGVGTSNPQYSLQVVGTLSATAIVGPITGSNITAGQVVIGGTGGVLSGTNNFVWDNTNGSLGIGTSSPGGKLDVNDGANGRFRFGGTVGTAAYADVDTFLWRSSNTFTTFALLNGTGLGLGMSSPSARLFVSGSGTASTPTMVVREGVVLPTGGAGVLDVQNSAGTSLLFVSGSGRIGIGSSTPAAVFEVFNSSISTKYVIGTSGTGGQNESLSSIITSFADSHVFRSNTQVGATILQITPSGLIPGTSNAYDIGTTSSRWRTIYASNISGSLTGSNISAGQVVVAGTGGVVSGSNDLYWSNSTRRLGIGTSSPTYPFEINATSGTPLIKATNSVGSYTLDNYDFTAPSSFNISAGSGTSYLNLKAGSGAGTNARIAFSTQGLVRASIANNGNFTIGDGSNLAPISRFEVTGSGNTSSTSTMNLLNSNNTSLMFVRDDGNVGIGTSNPPVRLAIGSVSSKETLVISSSNAAYNLSMYAQATAADSFAFEFGGTPFVKGYNNANLLDFIWNYGFNFRQNTSTSPWVTINNSNLGIGGTNPTSRLEVTGSGATSATSAIHALNSSNASLFFVRNDGNVGFGTTSPTARIDALSGTIKARYFEATHDGELLAGADASGYYFASGFGKSTAIPIFMGNSGVTYISMRTVGTERLRINATGLVPGANLTYDIGTNATRWNDLYVKSGSFSGDVSITGNLSVLGTQTIVNSETVNIKDNIILLNANPTPLTTGGIYVADTTANITGSLIWDTATDTWKAGRAGSETTLISGSGATNYVAKWNGTNGLTSGVMYDDGTNVGIGTAGPTNYANYKGLTINDTNGAFIYLKNTAGTATFEQLLSATETYIKNISSLPLWFGTANTERLRITTDTNAPVYVSAAANQALRVNSATSNSAFLATFNDFTSIGANRNPASGVFADTSKAATEIAVSGGSTSYIAFATAAAVNTAPTERMRIDGSGNVGINTNTMTLRLEVSGSDAKIHDVRVGRGPGSDILSTVVGYLPLNNQSAGDRQNTAVGAYSLYNVTTGNQNVGIGIFAGQGIINSSGNTAVGAYAAVYLQGAANTSIGANANQGVASTSVSNYNTAVGYQANRGIITGANNTSIGAFAGYSVTTGGSNFFGGYQAGYSNSVGINNVALGSSALYTNTSGSSNVGIGVGALYSSATTNDNVAIGANAGYTYANSEGTFIGSAAGQLSTGTGSTAVGRLALQYGTGTYNVAVGRTALIGNASSTGGANVAVGSNTLAAYTTAANNTAIGYQAGQSVTTGGSNFFGGYQAGYSNSVGNFNVILGNVAAYALTSGSSNVSIGSASSYTMTTGTRNTVVGDSAGYEFTTATDNTYIGRFAAVRQRGNYNVAVGAESLNGITVQSTASNNTAIGYQAGFSVTTGASNFFGGFQAGLYVTTGGQNVLLGSEAGYNVANGSRNVIIGRQAGNRGDLSDTTHVGYRAGVFNSGNNNTSIGSYALNGVDGSSSGANNTAIGYQAGQSVTTGGNNFFGGYQSGYNVTTATQAIAIGYQALYSAGVNGNQVAVGYQALFNNTAFDNVGIGILALTTNTSSGGNAALGAYAARYQTGSTNTALGHSALIGVSGQSTAANNTAIGYQAGNVITTGGGNLIAGYQAGLVQSVAANNVFLGYQAGVAVTSGSNNVFVGSQAGGSATTGVRNTVVGTNALLNVTTSSDTVAIGNDAGRYTSGGGLTTSAGTSIFIGHDARPSASGETNQIVIGAQTNGNGSNTTTIGNASVTKTVIQAGNVGLGTTNPSVKLHVSGAYGTAEALRIQGGADYDALLHTYYDNIGTNRATVGYAQYASDFSIVNKETFGALTLGTANSTRVYIRFDGNVGIGDTNAISQRLLVAGSTSDSSAAAIEAKNSSSTSLFYVRNDGNVGIGSASPGQRLTVRSADNSAATNVARIESNNGVQAMLLRYSGLYGSGGGLDLGTDSTNDVVLKPNSTERVRVAASSGNVTPGTDNTQSLGSATLRWANVYATNIVASGSLGPAYTTASSTSGDTAIFDTVSVTTDAAVYELMIKGNPNLGGSGNYLDVIYGKIIIGTGWNGSAATNYIQFICESPSPRSLYPSGGGPLVADVVYFQSGSEKTNVTSGSAATIRVKISGYVNNTGYNTTVRLKQLM